MAAAVVVAAMPAVAVADFLAVAVQAADFLAAVRVWAAGFQGGRQADLLLVHRAGAMGSETVFNQGAFQASVPA
jgi:hypothetical protein